MVNFKVLSLIILYYSVLSMLFYVSGSILTDAGASSNIAIDEGTLSEDELDTAGVSDIGFSLGKFLAFIGFGIGLPDDTPSWFQFVFRIWSIAMSLFTVFFIYQAARGS